MKKFLSLLTTVVLLMSLAVAALAAPSYEQMFVVNADGQVVQNGISGNLLRYEYTSSISANITFSGSTAYCTGAVDPKDSLSASITATLYKKDGTSWTRLTSWSASSTGGSPAVATGTYSVSSGTYKLTATANVGNGSEYPSTSTTRTK